MQRLKASNNPFSVHPCDEEEHGGCTQNCLKDGNKVRCSCNKGLQLEEDGKTCVKGNLSELRRPVGFRIKGFYHIDKFLFQFILVTKRITVVVKKHV